MGEYWVKNNLGGDNIEKLANEFVYRRFVMNRDRMNALFQEIDAGEYLALSIVYSQRNNDHDGKTYLKDISEGLEIPMRRCSNMMRNLKNRGYIIWTHDGDGRDGTYVYLTDLGTEVYLKQRKMIREYVKSVMDKFGEDNLIEFLSLARKLENIVGTTDDDENVTDEMENGHE